MSIRLITIDLAAFAVALAGCTGTVTTPNTCHNPCSTAGPICDPAGSGQIGTCTLNAITGCYSVTGLAACLDFATTCVAGATACLPPSMALQILTTTLSDAQVAVTYGDTLSATGGSAPYTWTVISGSACGSYSGRRYGRLLWHTHEHRKQQLHGAGQ